MWQPVKQQHHNLCWMIKRSQTDYLQSVRLTTILNENMPETSCDVCVQLERPLLCSLLSLYLPAPALLLKLLTSVASAQALEMRSVWQKFSWRDSRDGWTLSQVGWPWRSSASLVTMLFFTIMHSLVFSRKLMGSRPAFVFTPVCMLLHRCWLFIQASGCKAQSVRDDVFRDVI